MKGDTSYLKGSQFGDASGITGLVADAEFTGKATVRLIKDIFREAKIAAVPH